MSKGNIVMKVINSSNFEFTIVEYNGYIFVKWVDCYGQTQYQESDVKSIKHALSTYWKQVPNTIEDMEVGDYAKYVGNSTIYFTQGKLYNILELSNKILNWRSGSEIVFYLTGEEGYTYSIGNWNNNFKFHKKAYVELFMQDNDINKQQEKNMAQFKNMKFRVESPEHSELIQKELFKLGYDWMHHDYKGIVMFTDAEWLHTDNKGNLYNCPEGDPSRYALSNNIDLVEYKLVSKYEIVEQDIVEVEGFKIERSKLLEFLKSQQGE